jgi:hypothetical protein
MTPDPGVIQVVNWTVQFILDDNYIDGVFGGLN